MSSAPPPHDSLVVGLKATPVAVFERPSGSGLAILGKQQPNGFGQVSNIEFSRSKDSLEPARYLFGGFCCRRHTRLEIVAISHRSCPTRELQRSALLNP